MNRILIWDFPIRVFHWIFAGSLGAALAIGWGVDEQSARFPLHMLFGLVAGFALLIRLILGFGGSRWNRFEAFPLRPAQLIRYLRSQRFPGSVRYPGHNPGSALAALSMFMIVPALIVTGMAARSEAMEEAHEVLAPVLAGVIAAHLAGLAWHRLRHGENVGVSMITGRRNGAPSDAIPSANGFQGVIVLVVIVAWGAALFLSYDRDSGFVRLPVLDKSIRLTEPHHDQADAMEGQGDTRGKVRHHDD